MFSTIGFQLGAYTLGHIIWEETWQVPILVIDEISETRRVNHGESEPHTVLFDI